MTVLARLPVARLVVLFLLVLLGLALIIALSRDTLHRTLSDWTGEEDTLHQISALRFAMASWFQPAPDVADYAPVRYTNVPPFGVNTFLEQEVEESKVRESLQLIHDAGFHFIRQEFPWEDIEKPAKGQFWDTKYNHSTWDKYDRIVSLANEYGLEIIARLDHPPDWTRHDGHARGNFAPPDNYSDYGDYVATVVSRYSGKIKYYQLWNEPNIYPEWGDQPVNAADYTRLLKLAYARAKVADPNVVIISAGLAQTIETGPRNLSDLTFLEQMYQAGARDSFDILAVQDYGLFTGPGDRRVDPQRTNFSRPILIREIMVKYGDGAKPVWAMEVGWNAVPANMDAPFGRVSDALQAHYAVMAYQRAQEEWSWMGPMMYWFFKRADDHETNQPMYYFRLLDPNFAPHPVFAALTDYIKTARYLGTGFHQQDHWALDYEGGWETKPATDNTATSYRIGRPGDVLNFTFHGTDAELSLSQNPYGGIASVNVDGNQSIVDLRATDPESGGRIVLAQGLPDGEHHVSLTVSRGEIRLEGIVIRRTGAWMFERIAWVGGILLSLALAWTQRGRLRQSSGGFRRGGERPGDFENLDGARI